MQHYNVEFMMFMELLTVNIYQLIEQTLANTLCKLHPGQKIQYRANPSSMSWTQHLEGCGHFSFRREVRNVARVMDLR